MKYYKAVHRILDSIWVIEYKVIGNAQIEIIKYSRDDPDGYELENELPKGHLVEDPGRIVYKAVIDGQEYEVVNPQYVFSYQGEK